jgi:transposase
MAARRTSVADVRELVRRLIRGQSERGIAQDLGISRNTVAAYRRWSEQQGLLVGPLPDAATLARLLSDRRRPRIGIQEVSKTEPYRERVEDLARAGVEAKAIWQILQEEKEFQGSYSSVKRFVRRLDRTAGDGAVLRLEVAPGEEAQVDFGYAGRLHDPDTGKDRRAWVFVMVLSHSRHQYAELVFDQTVATWTRLHATAFEFFGGVPRRLILDNLKAAIVRASLYDPEIQRSYRELCQHYDVLASPCRPRTPEHKGKVEKGGVHYVKRNALAGRTFEDIHAANRHLRRWCLEVAGRRTHGTTHQVPLEVFQRAEKAALQPLPATRWELCEWKACKLHPDCHVVFDKAYYSAPHRLIRHKLMARATARLVQLFHDHELVAVHRRAVHPGQRRTIRDHLPPDKVAWLMKTPSWCRAQARAVGPATAAFVEHLLGDKPLDRLRGAQGVIGLAKKYGPKRLEAACSRALHFEEIRVRTVKSILVQGLDFQPLLDEAPDPPPAPSPRHARRWTEFFPDTSEQGDETCRSTTK